MKHLTKIALPIAVALILLGGIIALVQPQETQADAVTNYYTSTWSTGATSYITTGGSTGGQDVSGYGSAVIHVVADASNTTGTLTITPFYSNETLNCSVVTDWFTGTDYLAYSQGATSYAPIDYTTQDTSTVPIVITYTYGSPASLHLRVGGYNSVDQAFTLTGDDFTGREVRIYGRCMKLTYGVSYGTITPTVYVMTRDLYE